MWIKICGNTRLEDCLLAAALGADAVGFVFAEGRRTVSAEHVAGITAHLPLSVEKIGVFTSTDAGEITQKAKAAGLTGIQLHGSYDPRLVRAIRADLHADLPMRMFQVAHWDLDRTTGDQVEAFSDGIDRITADGLVDAVLVDSHVGQRSGGTGRAFDWQAAAPALQKSGLPVIVAGGLNPENIATAIETITPWGVDVSSGIEDSPGVKNRNALRRFVEIARETDR